MASLVMVLFVCITASSHAQTTEIDVDSTLCSMLDNKTNKDKMVSDVCAETKIPGCMAMAPKIWDFADVMCHKVPAVIAMEKMFCHVAENKFVEGKMVAEMCKKLDSFSSKSVNISMPDFVCQGMLKALWETAAKTCTHQSNDKLSQQHGAVAHSHAPAHEVSVDSALCGLLDNKTFEEKMIGNLCAEAQIPGCSTMAPKMWGIADVMCHKAPAMEKKFCILAENKFVENIVATEMCKKLESFQQKAFNMSMPDTLCQGMVKNVWGAAAKICARQSNDELLRQQQLLQLADAASSIESTLCSLLDNKTIEAKMTSDLCLKVKTPGCTAMVTKMWGVADVMCSKAPAMEKKFCDLAENKFLEGLAAAAMCKKMENFEHKRFNISMPDALCQSMIKNVWGAAAQICTHPSKAADAAQATQPTPVIIV